MPKLKRYDGQKDGEFALVFYCPGCRETHPYSVPRWTWNGDMERPTFAPSLRVLGHKLKPGVDQAGPKKPEDWDSYTTCHLFVRDGKIEYCGDCPHPLAGQTIDLPELPEDAW